MIREMRDNTKGNDADKKPAHDYLGNKTVPKPKPFSMVEEKLRKRSCVTDQPTNLLTVYLLCD